MKVRINNKGLVEVECEAEDIEEARKLLDSLKPKYKPQGNRCEIHNVDLVQGYSKKTGKPFKYHKLETGQYCFGN